MKKIGILYGRGREFPEAFIREVNRQGEGEIEASGVTLDKVIAGETPAYAVIVDGISAEVPFYREYLKTAALSGTAVVNNPFLFAGDSFFSASMAAKLGVPVPRAALLPSRDLPEGTTGASFPNLAFPLDWDHIFRYVGFPAYLAPSGGGEANEGWRIDDAQGFFERHAVTGRRPMILRQEIDSEANYRVYWVGEEEMRVTGYDPRRLPQERYRAELVPTPSLEALLKDYSRRLNLFLGYEVNAVDFTVSGGIPYAVGLYNPATEVTPGCAGEENFRWLIERVAAYAIRRALGQKDGADNLHWGEYVGRAVNRQHFARWTTPPEGEGAGQTS
jgi:hypothetical protein